METLVVYKSKTGFTKKYAEVISEKTGCALMELKEAAAEKMSGFDRIVFGSRVHAGIIDGLKEAKELFQKSGAGEFIIFATGATPNSAQEVVNEVWKNNLSQDELATIPHFYMQGGLCYEKMSFGDKMIMKMVSAMMSRKKDKDSVETGFTQAITHSFDISSEEYAEPLIDYLTGEK